MPKLFWTGKLSGQMMLIANLNCMLGWITGSARDSAAMKLRMRQAYEGTCSSHVTEYDKQAAEHYAKIARALLEDVDLAGKEILDVGCGTGILSVEVLRSGAAKVACGDASGYMLSQCEKKLLCLGFEPRRVEIRQLDAEALPYAEGSFDAVVSAMVLGIVPNQDKVVAEMSRVVRSGGLLAIATHGPEYVWEGADATFRALPKRRTIGYRVEYWPRQEREIGNMLAQAGLVDVRTRKLFWQDTFRTGGEMHDFFAATSASWWLTKFPPNEVAEAARKTREYFERRNVRHLTYDIVVAYGRKP